MKATLVGALACVCVLVGFTPALAQRTSGVIHGTVADASGGVIPGVTVTLRGVAVQGAPTAVTTETGTYRFPSVPPGTYTLEFVLGGFETQRREGIAISAADALEVNVTMRLSSLQETVTVSGGSPVVDTSTAQLNTTYNREWVQNAPIPRTSIDVLLKAAPGVNPNQEARGSMMSVFGSGAAANIFQLDGNDYRNPNSNLQSASINPDMIEEIGVLSLGAPAEYGEVSGGVFNVITRRGSNAFHGDSSFYFQHQNLTDRNTAQALDNGRPYQRVHFRDVTAQLGGPIRTDKLWFFGSYQFQQDADVQPGADPNFPARLKSPRAFGKVNAQLTTNHRVEGSYYHDYVNSVAAATAFQSPESVTLTNRHTFLPNVLWTSVLSPSTFVDARYTGSFVRVSLDPQIEGAPRIQPRYIDLTAGRTTGGILYWADYTQSRQTASAKLSHYATDFLKGSHDLKVGVQYVRGVTHWGPQGYNDVVYTYGAVPSIGYFWGPYHYGGIMNGTSAFVDDTMRIGERLTLNFGVRFDHFGAGVPSFPVLDLAGNETTARSAAAPGLIDWNLIAPRLGFVLKLDAAGRTVVKGHAGRYYHGVNSAGQFETLSPSILPYHSFTGRYDAAGNPIGLVRLRDNTNQRIDPNYDGPYTDQFNIGFDRELIKDLGVSVYYVHKRDEDLQGWDDVGGTYVPVTFIDDRGVGATGQSYTVQRLVSPLSSRLFVQSNRAGMYGRYNGVSIQANKRMSNRWQLQSSLTLSKSEGRDLSSLRSANGTQSNASYTLFGQNPNDFVNTDGLLIGDRPVQFKVQGVVQLPFELLFSANYRHLTGRAWGRTARVTGLGIPTTIRAEVLDGSRRIPDVNMTDLRVQRSFPLGGTRRASLFFDVLNVTNSNVHENVASTLNTSAALGSPTLFTIPRRAMIGFKFVF
jgi:hypothetical protein